MLHAQCSSLPSSKRAQVEKEERERSPGLIIISFDVGRTCPWSNLGKREKEVDKEGAKHRLITVGIRERGKREHHVGIIQLHTLRRANVRLKICRWLWIRCGFPRF